MSPYAEHDRERRLTEPAKATLAARGEFQRDRARVLHSSALRRLASKTQVVLAGEDDFPRTRLTHSLEVAQIGRELGAALGCDPDLVETGCLAHDIGHPPYGHNGEDALDEAAAACGGFEGNAQTFRLLTRLEPKVLDDAGRGAGLNLTRAGLDAATKYPWPRRAGARKFGAYDDDLPVFDWLRAGAPDGQPCLEAQVMDWADDVGFCVHDVEDGVHAGHIDLRRLTEPDEAAALAASASAGAECHDLSASDLRTVLAELLEQPAFAGLVGAGAAPYDGSLGAQVALKRMTSELTARFVAAALTATRAEFGPAPLSRYAARLQVPDRKRAEVALLKAVAFRFVMSRRGADARYTAQQAVIGELVGALCRRAPDALDPALRPAWSAAADDATRLRVVVDQVAGLTDTSVRSWHARLTG